jgi:hypothetical protein
MTTLRCRLVTLALAIAVPAILTAVPATAQTGSTGMGSGPAGPSGVMMDRPMSPAARSTMPGSMPMQQTMPRESSGATTTGPVGTTSGSMSPMNDAPMRSGAARLDDEAARTALLNRFGGLGFSALESFRRTGAGYEADVRTITGERMTVDIDPRSGAVSTRR